MNIIVQKFGGTSLNKKALRKNAVAYIQGKLDLGYLPVIVVSAIGREGEPYATDTLIKQAELEHPQLEIREKDILMSCGEIISTIIMVQTLRAAGLKAVALSGAQAGIITSSDHGIARVDQVNPAKILGHLQNKKIPVVAGFQGMDMNGEITTLGRGGSDTTASVLATVLNAEFIEIYSDVSGLHSADPKIVPKTKFIEYCSYIELVEMANKGARIIDPRAVEIAARNNIPISLRSISSDLKKTGVYKIKHDRPVTGVTSKRNIAQVKIITKEQDFPPELQIFQQLAAKKISVDLIDIRECEISFIVQSEEEEPVKAILKKNNCTFYLRNDLAKVSIVGSGMTGQPGIMAKLVTTLTKANIAIFECTDSHTTISCLIKKNKEKTAVNELHKNFIK